MVRRFVLAGVLLIFFAGCATTQQGGGSDASVPKLYDAETLYKNTRVMGASFSSDESRILYTSDASGVFNAYVQASTGGEAQALTQSKTDAYIAVSFFPSDDRFLFTADQGGNELNHLFVRELDGTKKDLTPGEKLKASFAGWSGDRAHFYVQTNERNPKFFDIYRYATDGYARELIFQNDDGWMPGPISRDGRWLSLNKVRNNADSDIYLHDLSAPDAKPVHITPHNGSVDHSTMTFTPNSKELWYSTDEHGEFRQVWSYIIEKGAHQLAVKEAWDVTNVVFSETGKFVVKTVNADAKTQLTIYERESRRTYELPNLPDGDVNGAVFSRSETRLAFYVTSDRSPPNLFTIDLKSGKFQQLTSSLNPAVNPRDLVDGQVIRFKSFDDVEIPGILYTPKQASKGTPVPALVWVHGGPGGQSRLGYRALIQHLVNHGYAIFAVNNRGSSGYGKTFFHLDDKRHGEDDLRDVVLARKHLETMDWIDKERIGIIGGSYGGFMVVAALAFAPEAFEVGIDIFGVTNWVRTLKSIPEWWAAFREYLYAELGDPATDEERLKRISPLFHAEKIKRPLLVIQGKNDPRVLKVESDEMVAAVKKNGVPVEYVVFDDEGHGFRKRDNRIAASEAFLKFLDQHLKRKD